MVDGIQGFMETKVTWLSPQYGSVQAQWPVVSCTITSLLGNVAKDVRARLCGGEKSTDQIKSISRPNFVTVGATECTASVCG